MSNYPDNVLPVVLVDPPKAAYTRFAFREDSGMILLPLGVDLPAAYQVDFSKDEKAGTSITQIGDENGAAIPSQFFADGTDFWAFVYLAHENGGYTRYKICVSVIGRPDRTNEQPTPEQQSAIDEAIAALNAGVERADGYSKTSQSWAVGGTGTRPGEDTDNAKYYSEVAEQQATSAGFIDVHIDDNGHLIYTRSDTVDIEFSLDENGHLILEVA